MSLPNPATTNIPPTSQLNPRRWWILWAVMLAYLPIVLDMTILHIAVPSLTRALQASSAEILWIIDIYPLMMAGLLVPMGTLADRVGQRRMLLTGLVLFLGASLVAAYAPTAMVLIGARIGLALGASMVVPSILALIRQSFEDSRERAIALGLWGTVSSAGAALGPLAGGFLLERFWWGAVFLINIPIMMVVWPLAFGILPKQPPVKQPGKWAPGQALLLIAGLILSVYAVKSGLKSGASPLVLGSTLIGGLSLLGIFIQQQRTSPHPMLDLSLFQRPAISTGLIIALLVSGSFAGVELTLAQELQFVIGRSPLEAGLFMMPLMVASACGGPMAGFLVATFGLRAVSSLSLLIAAASFAGLAMSDFHQPGWGIIALLTALGLSLSTGLTASSIAIMSSAPPDKAGAAGAIEGVGYELGAGLGITAFGVLLSRSYSAALQLPPSLDLPSGSGASIGETLTTAATLGGPQGEALAAAGRQAFSGAHMLVLSTVATTIALLAALVFVRLRHTQSEAENLAQTP